MTSALLAIALVLGDTVTARVPDGVAARLPLCASADATPWDRAKHPGAVTFCLRIAQAESELGADPARARALAGEANEALPGQAAPLVLTARAFVAERRPRDALTAFSAAIAIDPGAADDGRSQLALARALRDGGSAADARRAYRAAARRSAELASPRARGDALLEAAAALFGEGKTALDEVIALLRRVPVDGAPEQRAKSLALLALALDRSGDADAAQGLADEAKKAGGGGLFAGDTELGPEVIAVRALLARSKSLWDAYATRVGTGAPWSANARAHAESAGRGGR